MGIYAITGSASGLGAAVATRLRADGHRVIGIDRSEEAEIVADLGSEGGRRAALDGIGARSGDRLDGAVSCAGLGPYEDPESIIRVNYFGAMALIDGLRELLGRGSDPAAVVISSIGAIFDEVMQPDLLGACHGGDEPLAARLASRLDGTTVYSNAKRAVAQGVRRRVAAWGALGIRLNAVGPGKMETPMLDELLASAEHAPAIEALPVALGRSAPANEIAGAVCFLLGTDARYVHGQLLLVDGGSDALVRPDHV